ncbi:MAG: 23S rRNA (adenine(2503)-C(2))-methyltransferase RlmN [Arenicellales bacterium]|nr:23S rRNA (adenine(2503)-C(2))-methyltransferase RlmN [Arenicellales bacterium]MDP6291361.1 23S rRNA (adenine(2503)-C(2))-methyltransferase RlmN [Arenicellales bacterium]
MSQQINLLGLDRSALQEYFVALGVKEFHARQVLKWVYQRGVTDFSKMTDLGLSLRQTLSERAMLALPEKAGEQISEDGTWKWLFRLEDGNCIETVFIPEDDRGTLCVSSQVGCTLNCTFCATARQGFSRNLQASEIIGQLWLAGRLLADAGYGPRAVTNVVMMGMGEPLLNYDAVVSAIRLMLDDLSFGLSRRRVTLSTAGVVPAIDRLAKDCPVSLAVSLHAVEDDIRDQLVPLNRKYPIDQLLHACRRFLNNDSRRRITFEYVMLDGINDSTDHARKLVRLLRDIPAKVNLIPFNSVEGIAYDCSPKLVIDRFREEVLAGGLMTITRRTRGADIAAACGQLAGEVCDRTRRSARYALGGGSR